MKVLENLKKVQRKVMLPGLLGICNIVVAGTMHTNCLFFFGQPKEPENLGRIDRRQLKD